MAIPSELRRVQAAIDNNNHKELEWSLWYARMRQSVPSARPADVKYWSAIERQVQDILTPPPPPKVYPTRKKKKSERGLGMSPLMAEDETHGGAKGQPELDSSGAGDEQVSRRPIT